MYEIERLKRMVFIITKHNMQILGLQPNLFLFEAFIVQLIFLTCDPQSPQIQTCEPPQS